MIGERVAILFFYNDVGIVVDEGIWSNLYDFMSELKMVVSN